MARVLVADDDASLREVIISMLALDGHEVVAVATESEAVLLYDSRTTDLLVLDVNMQNGGAREILERLDAREQGVQCPVLVVTGEGNWGGSHPRLAGVLTKPFLMDDLRQAVSSALARS